MQESSRPVAAQTQLEVHGCTYSWQLQLMAVSISLLCADIIMRGCFPICCCCCRCCSLVVVEVIIQCIAVARLRLKFSCSREIIESNAPNLPSQSPSPSLWMPVAAGGDKIIEGNACCRAECVVQSANWKWKCSRSQLARLAK